MAHQVANDILIPEIERLLREGREVRFTPSGVSMRPFIEGGRDTVLLRKLPTVRVGDACLVRTSEGRYVLHRVIAVTSETRNTRNTSKTSETSTTRITLMGDGNLRGVETCTLDDVIGTVVRVESPGGRRKYLGRGRIWYHLLPLRWLLLKVYRKVLLLLDY